MRTFSTPESALKGEITKLGIIECALAVSVYVAIALGLHTLRYFYLVIAVAPLTLLRTEESTEWTLRAFLAVTDKVDKVERRVLLTVTGKVDRVERRVPPVPLLLWLFALAEAFTFFPVLVPVLRVAGVVYGFARRPVRTIAEMPRNWIRQALCTDLAHPPEALPGELSHRGDFINFIRLRIRVGEFINFARFGAGNLGEFELPADFVVSMFIARVVNLAIAVLLFLPPLFYRVSFKATAVCYLPFLWVAQATAGRTLPLRVRLERVTKGELEKVGRWLALFVLGLFGVVAALHFGVTDLTSVTTKFLAELAVANLIRAMSSFQWWHATLLADALLTFWLFLFSDAALPRMDAQVWSEPFVANTLSMTSFFRSALAVLTITYFCWVAILKVVPAGVRGFLSML